MPLNPISAIPHSHSLLPKHALPISTQSDPGTAILSLYIYAPPMPLQIILVRTAIRTCTNVRFQHPSIQSWFCWTVSPIILQVTALSPPPDLILRLPSNHAGTSAFNTLQSDPGATHCRYMRLETFIMLAIAFVINLFVVTVFAKGFENSSEAEKNNIGIESAGEYLGETFGESYKYLWAVGLLAAGQVRSVATPAWSSDFSFKSGTHDTRNTTPAPHHLSTSSTRPEVIRTQ